MLLDRWEPSWPLSPNIGILSSGERVKTAIGYLGKLILARVSAIIDDDWALAKEEETDVNNNDIGNDDDDII